MTECTHKSWRCLGFWSAHSNSLSLPWPQLFGTSVKGDRLDGSHPALFYTGHTISAIQFSVPPGPVASIILDYIFIVPCGLGIRGAGDRLRLSDPHGCRAGLFCAEQRNAVFHKAKIEMGRDWGELFQWLLRNGEPTGNSRHNIPVQSHHDEPAGRKWRCGDYHYYLRSIPAEHTVYRLLYGNSAHYRI